MHPEGERAVEGRKRMLVDLIKDQQKMPDWAIAQDLLFDAAQEQQSGIKVVILARNEEAVIGSSLRALSYTIGPDEEVHVVADHCQDQTERVARDAGAVVHVRRAGGAAGKGHALRWWLNQTRAAGSPDDMIAVLDADSLVAPNFFESVRARMQRGETVIQTRVEPIVRSMTPVTLVAAYSEIVEQRVNDAFRSWVKWPVRLRGTGMVIQRRILDEICPHLHTLVEDVELTILTSEQGIPIHFAAETYVADPKPNDQDGAVRQRARWMRGQKQVLSSYLPQILRLLARGFPGWSLLSSVLLKPKTLIIPIKAMLTVSAWIAALTLGGVFWGILAGIGTLELLKDAAVFLYGLRFVQDRRETIRALALAFVYLMMWLRSMVLSSSSGNVWLRVRPLKIDQPLGEGVLVEHFSFFERCLSPATYSGTLTPRLEPVPADGSD
jgi:cellulose synthase/poly-beta-1,6-N-acetylglucosamine synthase-like glycosyltransferase